MSNHEGSYLLNNVLLAAQKAGLFKTTSKKQKRAFLNEVIQIAFDYDCNPGGDPSRSRRRISNMLLLP